MRAVKEKANAKINLYLDVVSRREDGFHDIKSIMHSISLSDAVTVSYAPSKTTSVRMSVKGSRYLPTDEKNLAVKAALLFLETACKTAYIHIHLEKRIPIAAGLAGGSSDAAATLRAMNRLFDKVFTERALLKMAEKLGSDVPYCLYGKTAICEGRGDIITKLPDTLNLNAVVAVANEHVATPIAYSTLDGMYSSFDGSIETGGEDCYILLLNSIKSGKVNGTGLYNIFEKAILPMCPKAEKIKNRLTELGAYATLMSGSGPSVFGLFDDEEKAQAACFVLREENVTAYYATSV